MRDKWEKIQPGNPFSKSDLNSFLSYVYDLRTSESEKEGKKFYEVKSSDFVHSKYKVHMVC